MKGMRIRGLASPRLQFFVFLVALTVFLLVLLGLVWPVRERMQLQSALAATQQRRQQQEILFPFYQSLLARDRISNWKDLLASSPEPLQQEQVVQVPAILADLARAHGYRITDREDYRVRMGTGEKRVLQVVLPLQGRYADLGALLGDLLRQPFLDRVTSLRVEELGARQAITIGMDLLLEP